MKESLNKLLWNITNRRDMYIAEKDYQSLRCFIEGYFTALGDVYNENIHKRFHDWVKQHLNKKFSINVFDYIYNEEAGKVDKVAEAKLLLYLEQFVSQENISSF